MTGLHCSPLMRRSSKSSPSPMGTTISTSTSSEAWSWVVYRREQSEPDDVDAVISGQVEDYPADHKARAYR